ncbi:MAG: GNAT family N-acetyltransferase [Candidatus Sumerlaeaceae bacterium]
MVTRSPSRMHFSIRPGRPDEVPLLCDSIAALELWQQLGISSQELQFACTHDPMRLIYVAEATGLPAACIMFRAEQALKFLCERVFRSGIIYPPENPDGIPPQSLPDGGYVNMLAVFEASQGRGMGAALLEAAEQRSAESSDRMYLCVSEVNSRARAFYERNGYSFVAEAHDCVRPGNTEHLMVKALQADDLNRTGKQFHPSPPV